MPSEPVGVGHSTTTFHPPDDTPRRKARWEKLKHLHKTFCSETVAAIAGLELGEVAKWREEELSTGKVDCH